MVLTSLTFPSLVMVLLIAQLEAFVKELDVPTGYPTFIYYEDETPTDSIGEPSSTVFPNTQQYSGHHYVSSPDVVSKWYMVLSATSDPSADPTSFPSSKPSPVSPSLHPSSSPTMMPTTLPSIISTREPTDNPTQAPSNPFLNESRCINFLLTDTFGDGWDTGSMFLYPSDGSAPAMITLPCGKTSLMTKFCFHPEVHEDGDYVVVGIMGYNPSYPWEIHWEALNTFDNKVYVGGYETSLTFIFHIDLKSRESHVSLLSSIGELPQETTCETCVKHFDISTSPSTSPKAPPAAKKGPVHKKSPRNSMDATTLAAVGDKLTSLSLGGYEDTWFSPDWYGSNFYVSDVYGTDLIYSGSLCDGKVGCDFNLADGTYKWRVTGALYTYSMGIYWKFCGIEGSAMNELTFSVKGENCQAIELLDLNSICIADEYELLETEVSLTGSLRLHGIEASDISENGGAVDVLSSSLSQEFMDSRPNIKSEHVSVNIMSVKQSSSDDIGTTSHSFNGESFSTDVIFSMKLSARAFREDGSSALGRMNLLSHCTFLLQKSMTSGLFLVRLAHKSNIADRPLKFSPSIRAELLDLVFEHKQSSSAAQLSSIGDVVLFIGIVALSMTIALLSLISVMKMKRKGSYAVLLSSALDVSESQNSLHVSP